MPGRPSISTRHSRHDPKAARRSVAHSLGMSMPASAAAAHDRGAGGDGDAQAVDHDLDARLAGHGRRPEDQALSAGSSSATLVRSRCPRRSGRSPRRNGAARCAPDSGSARPSRTAIRPSSAHTDPRAARGWPGGSTPATMLVDDLDAADRRRSGTACTSRRTPRRRTPSRSGPGGPCRRCRRTPRCRRARSWRPPPRTPRSPSGGRTATAAGRRRAGRRPGRPAPAGRWPCPRRSPRPARRG